MEALYQLSYSPVQGTGHVTTRLASLGKAGRAGSPKPPAPVVGRRGRLRPMDSAAASSSVHAVADRDVDELWELARLG